MHHRLLPAILLAAAAAAQSLTLPLGSATAEGDASNLFPWGTTSTTFAGVRAQTVYDSGDLVAQGVTAPVLITRLRWRANQTAGSWVGGTYAAATVTLSTCPHDWSAVAADFAANEGFDRTICHSGPVAFLPGTGGGLGVVGPTVVDLTLTTPFFYDPSRGDLVVDVDHAVGANFTANGAGTSRVALDVQTSGAAAARAFASTTYPQAGGTLSPHGMVVTVDHVPASGLFARFTASAIAGPSPHAVQFTDRSFTTDPGGILSYAWDFDGDAVTDSTAANPTFVYSACGDYTVRLTVTDSTHPAASFVRTGLVRIDDLVANFSIAQVVAPNVFTLTDLSTPPATAWAWDFDSDGTIDSTLQSPIAVLPLCQESTITLTAQRHCKSATRSAKQFASTDSLLTSFSANNAFASGVVFSDYHVANPIGISLCAFDHHLSTAAGTPFTFDVYVTPTTYVGKDNDLGQWRLVGHGSGVSRGTGNASLGVLDAPVYLPNGDYGVGLAVVGSIRYTGTGTGGAFGVYGNADLTITTGAARSSLFAGGSFFSVREWNGRVHYDAPQTAHDAGLGFFGVGCAGTLPISRMTVVQGPVLGSTLQATFDHLPLDFAVSIAGFSRTVFQGGIPLPVDLSIVGAPGCFGRVSDDLLGFLFGASQVATWTVAVPNNVALLGVPFFAQAAVADPANAFGFVFSDAWGGAIGL